MKSRGLWCLFTIALLECMLEAVDTSMDQHLCKDALEHILPNESKHFSERQVDSIVAALVQVDATLGITPCQYKKLKGFTVHPADGGISASDTPGGQSQPGVSPGTSKFLSEAASASGASAYGRSDQQSAAFRAGQMIGSPFRPSNIADNLQGMGKAIGAGFDEINAGMRALGLPDIELGPAGKWIDKAGEAVGDVVVDTFKGTFDFFSGIIVGIFPSAAGRRRVVFDQDCDMIQHEIDSIEDTCANYRYQRLEKLYPVLRDLGQAETKVMANRTRLNHTIAGDPLAFEPGMREIFTQQKNMLYGENGTCLKPTKNSIAYIGNELINAVFQLTNDTQSSFDTHWANIKQVDVSMKNSSADMVETFTEGAIEVFNLTHTSQRIQGTIRHINAQGLADTEQALIANVSGAINRMQGNFMDDFAKATSKSDSLVEKYKKYVPDLQDRLDSVTDLMDASPDGLSRFTDTLNEGVNDVLQEGNRSISTFARDMLLNSLQPNAKRFVDQFDSQSESSIGNSQKDWKSNINTFTSEYTGLYKSRDGVLGDTARNVSQSFDEAKTEIDMNLADMLANQTTKFSDAQKSAKDASLSVKKVQSDARSTSAALKQLYGAMKVKNSNTVADTQTKISQILSVASNAASEQLVADTQQATDMRAAVSDASTNLDSSLTNLAYEARRIIADAVSRAAEASADQKDALSSIGASSQAQMQTASDALALSAKSASGDWQQMGEDGSDSLNSVVSAAELEQFRMKQDSAAAAAAAAAESQDRSADIEAGASGAAVNVRRGLIASGSAIDGLSKSAGAELSAQRDQIGSTLDSMTNLKQSLSGSNAQGDSQSSALFSSLSQSDDQTASGFSASAKAAASQASSLLAKSLTKIQGEQGSMATDLQNQLSKTAGSSVKRDTAEALIRSAVDAQDRAASGLSDLASDIETAPGLTGDKQDNLNTSLAGDLNSLVASTQTKAGSVLASTVDRQTSLTEEIGSAMEKTIGQSGKSAVINQQLSVIGSKVDSASKSQAKSAKSIFDSQASMETVLRSMISGLESSSGIVESVKSDSEKLDSNTAEKAKQIGLGIISTNSTLLGQLAEINDKFASFNKSYPDVLSKSVQDFIDALGADGMKLMDRIVARAAGGVDQAFDGSDGSASLNVLDQAGSVSSDFMHSAADQKGQADDMAAARMGELNGVSSEINRAKQYLKDNKDNAVSYQDYLDSQAGRMGRSSDALTQQLSMSVKSANSSLGLVSGKTATESSFAADMNRAQTQAMNKMADGTINQAQGAIDSSGSAMSAAVSGSTTDLHALEASMAKQGADLRAKVQNTLGSVSQADSEFAKNISSDKSQMTVQLMMVKRALRTLLSSWSDYADVETKKFEKMNKTDNEYIAMMSNRISTTNETSGSSLRTSLTNMGALNEDILQALEDYLSYQRRIEGAFDGYKHGLLAMNESAGAEVAQVKEMIYNMNANDQFVDSQERDQMNSAIAKFNAELDQRAQEAESSLIGATATGA